MLGGNAMPNDFNESVVDQEGAPTPSSQKEGLGKAVTCRASIYQDKPFTLEFSDALLQLQKALGFKLWVLIQNGGNQYGDISEQIFQGFNAQKNAIKKDEKIGLLIHSPGGSAGEAYKSPNLNGSAAIGCV